jgi:hypothetical protein
MRVVLALALLAAAASPAYAQPKDPLPTFVVDVRGLFAKLGQDTTTATDLGVTAQELPGTAIGGAVGVNFYPLKKKISLGFGAEGLLARATAQQAADAQTGAVEGPRIERRLQGISGTFSLNFGHGQGWSYVSAGIGPMRFQTFSGDLPASAPPFQMTQNFGAGARWFTNNHVAFCFDLRFYLTKPVDTTVEYAGRLRQRVMVISAGIAIK